MSTLKNLKFNSFTNLHFLRDFITNLLKTQLKNSGPQQQNSGHEIRYVLHFYVHILHIKNINF